LASFCPIVTSRGDSLGDSGFENEHNLGAMNEDGGYDILQLKEHIIERGGNVGSEALPLLTDARRYRSGPIEAFTRKRLSALEERYDVVYKAFLDYGSYAESYITWLLNRLRTSCRTGMKDITSHLRAISR